MKNSTSDPLLEQIRKAEHNKRYKFFSFFVSSKIYASKQFPENWYPGKIDKFIDHIRFENSKTTLLRPLLALVFISIFLLSTPIPHLFPFFILWIGFLAISIFISIKRATDKKANFDIYIDSNELIVADTHYRWADVYETAIMIYGANNKGSTYYLIVILNDTSYKVYPLINFSIFRPLYFTEKLARHLAFFRSLNNETT